jgi:hypothetical protein
MQTDEISKSVVLLRGTLEVFSRVWSDIAPQQGCRFRQGGRRRGQEAMQQRGRIGLDGAESELCDLSVSACFISEPLSETVAGCLYPEVAARDEA